MKVDLTQKICNFEGEPVREFDNNIIKSVLKRVVNIIEDVINDEDKIVEIIEKSTDEIRGSELTIGEVIRNVLGKAKDGEDGEGKLKRFNLGLKCVADKVDLSFDERKIIRDEVDESGYGPIVYGRIDQFLSGDEEDNKEEE